MADRVAALRVECGDWQTLGADATRVRLAVFVVEQGIALEEEIDAADAAATHVVVHAPGEGAVGTGRLLSDVGGVAHIGRMAVLRPWRGRGVGQSVIGALEQSARAQGYRQITLNAQRSAEGFYQRLGYRVQGEPFEEVGIAHVSMTREL